MMGYKPLQKGKQPLPLPPMPDDPAALLTSDQWNQVEQFVSQYATTDYPSASARHADIELVVQLLMHGLLTHGDHARTQIEMLYNECRTATTQSHVIAPLLTPAHRLLVRRILESPDERNVLGKHLGTEGRQRLLNAVAKGDSVNLVVELSSWAGDVLKIHFPPPGGDSSGSGSGGGGNGNASRPAPAGSDDEPDRAIIQDEPDRAIIEAVRNHNTAVMPEIFKKKDWNVLAQVVAASDVPLDKRFERLVIDPKTNPEIKQFAEKTRLLRGPTGSHSGQRPPPDSGGISEKQRQDQEQEQARLGDVTALEALLRRQGITPAVMGQSYGHEPGMPGALLELIAAGLEKAA
jgi:hypothetical protein